MLIYKQSPSLYTVYTKGLPLGGLVTPVKGVIVMLTYSELFQLGMLVVALIALLKDRAR